MIETVSTACKAMGAVGGAVAVECVQHFLGIPREVLYAAMAGACAGLAQRPRGDWERFLAPPKVGRQYVAVAMRSGLLAFMLAGNALICAWFAQLLQHVPLASAAAKVLPMATAGVLAWGSQRWLPSISEGIDAWIKSRSRGGA